LATLLKHCVKSDGNEDAIVIVAPAVNIAGTVVGIDDESVSGARIWIQMDSRSVSNVPELLDTSTIDMRWTMSDSNGHFELRGIPTGTGITLEVHHQERGSGQITVPACSTQGMVIRIATSNKPVRELCGIVMYADGLPAADSVVCMGESNQTRTSDDGRFRLVLHENLVAGQLVAYHIGYQPAMMPILADNIGDAGSSVIRLVLGDKALSISGRLEDADAKRLAGWRVTLGSGTEATQHALPPVFVEQLIDSGRREVTTDPAGAFSVGGLREGEYLLRAWDPKSLVMVETKPIKAGSSEIVIRVARDSLWPVIRGRVSARDGSPLNGVQLTLKVGYKVSTGLWTLERESALTDSLGGFQFEQVPKHGAMLLCQSDLISTLMYALPEDCNAEHLQIDVSRKLAFRIVRTSSAAMGADALGAITESGAHAFISLPGGYGGALVSFDALGNQIASTSEDVRMFVLYKGTEELLRVPIKLDPHGIAALEM
jgi:hypothetical protein